MTSQNDNMSEVRALPESTGKDHELDPFNQTSGLSRDDERCEARKRPRFGDDEAGERKAERSSEELDRGEWSEEMHKMFVAAIYEVGLRNSSPAVILENMAQKPKSITSERIKSKLQKYRNNRDKSKQEFLDEYSSFLHRAHAIECAGGAGGAVATPVALLEMMGSSKLLGGDAAAFLSYAVMKEGEDNQEGGTEGSALSTQFLRKGALDYVENFAGAKLPFPELTEEEKKTSLGVSMTFVMGLFLSMSQHLMRERANVEKQAGSIVEDESNSHQKLIARSSSAENALTGLNENTTAGQSDTKQPSKVSFSIDKAGHHPDYVGPQTVDGILPTVTRKNAGSGEETRETQALSSGTEMV